VSAENIMSINVRGSPRDPKHDPGRV